MDIPQNAQANLFDVYLRLRPPPAASASASANAERFILVEEPVDDHAPTHVTLNPPNDRRRAIEKFAFTRVFEENNTQLDLFYGTKVLPLVESALAPHGGDGIDGLLATLGMTGSGKTHTMLGCRSQRGLTQLALDVLFRSIERNIVDYSAMPDLEASLRSSDASEATLSLAPTFLESVFASDVPPPSRGSRATTPMTVRALQAKALPQLPRQCPDSQRSVRLVQQEDEQARITVLKTPPSQMRKAINQSKMFFTPLKSKLTTNNIINITNSTNSTNSTISPAKHYMNPTSAVTNKNMTKSSLYKGENVPPQTMPRRPLQRPSALPQMPDISAVRASCDPSADYAVLISMYEVYNDRIFDLLAPPVKVNATKEYRRRALLFKCTEASPDRKVVAGLRKVMCRNLEEALMVLEAGLHERRVAGTGSNSVSSRSHGFFCIEIKKRRRGRTNGPWGSSTLTIVDLAGSERARDAKTQGATLVEGGKINESLMYLGQCLQMQTDISNSNAKPNLRLFRQCKLTELLFTNSFPTATMAHSASQRRAPQKALMIVTADPLGDFNATSQILRYSALAREVTVPRMPSMASTISSSRMSAVSQFQQSAIAPTASSPLSSPVADRRSLYQSPESHGGRTSSVSDTEHELLENATMEIARMTDVIDQLNVELAQESEARMAAEAHLLSMEDRIEELEQEIREECYADFEQRLALEMARWKASLLLEQERGEEHWDRKVEVLARSVGVVVTAPSDEETENEDKENVLIENLEQENERLRREVAVLKRELSGRVPGKRAPLQERGDLPSSKSEVAGLGERIEQLKVSNGSPTKKMRKLPAKRWGSMANDDPF